VGQNWTIDIVVILKPTSQHLVLVTLLNRPQAETDHLPVARFCIDDVIYFTITVSGTDWFPAAPPVTVTTTL
jgi:hypothetical protein